ncbi:efflux RND transporter periplasmic adaptor subunit [Prochlorococcus marinus]|uniref:Possible membrane fusion protein n=1 Tax=Prochlorococcus marinus (strain MIT 9211) TaxID=93059 RepID=A9BBD2_PROM4|nr:efflux RND transporter periplasmic adaptor subunit [Prochlorococcus marinus]ABX09144.1 possible membrane fusion protein [Prochlorococcus marinus str. MIT 9211]
MVGATFKQKKLISLFSFLLVLIGGGVVWKIGPGKGNARDITSYTMNAEKGKLPSIISASGELQAEKTINVNPHRQGLIQEVYVEEGDPVARNQLIAKISDRDFPFRLSELRAEFENKQSAFKRRKQLFDEGAISAEKYSEYKKDFLTSKARLEQIQVEGEELLIRAPFKGMVTARYVEPGSFVSPNSRSSTNQGSPKTSVVEISQGLQVIAKVPESEIGRIQKEQKASVRVEAFPDERFESIVNNIAPRAVRSNNVTSFEVKLSLISPPPKLRIGMTADVEFQAGKAEMETLVPTVAIVTREGQPGLLIVGENNTPLFQKVELGSSSGSKTAILKGVSPGDPIFIDLPPWAKGKRD